MQRLAWFSPVQPDRSGIAQHSADLLPALARDRVIDLFTTTAATAPIAGAAGLFPARDFLQKQSAKPYDLIVYHLGGATCHDDVWPCLLRHPGLVVLHDDNLHEARARMLLAQGRAGDYRAEFAYNHPGAPASVADLGVSGLLGALVRLWPMRQVVLDSARALLVHNAWLAARIREEAPALGVDTVEPGVPDAPHDPDGRAAVRRRYGVPADAVVFAAGDDLTPARRISRILRALAALPAGAPSWRLMLQGEPTAADALLADARALGVERNLHVTGRISADEMPAHIAAADVGVNLRWPPARTISADWLHWLAAGKPTIVTDLVHASDVPALDPRDWTVVGRPAARDAAGNPTDPVAVAIDILDEDHSLALAVARLAADYALRAELGRAARSLRAARFTLDRMAAGYRQAIGNACRATYDEARRAHLPAHLLDGAAPQTPGKP